jgi:hypothetical protein
MSIWKDQFCQSCQQDLIRDCRQALDATNKHPCAVMLMHRGHQSSPSETRDQLGGTCLPGSRVTQSTGCEDLNASDRGTLSH